MALPNKGRLINFITGISGVNPGNQASLNLATNQRYHRLILQCTALNYSAATTVAFATSPGGTPATFTATIVNGQVTGIVIATAGSGQTPGTYNLTISDVTGTGATATAVVAGGGTVTATPIVTSGGTPSPIDPADFFTGFKILVNGVNMRDISAEETMKRTMNNGEVFPQLGQLDINFTEPARNVAYLPESTSWDMYGQSTLQLQMGINPSIVNPGISGTMEFDYERNSVTGADGKVTLFLQPISLHTFGFPLVVGRNDFNTLPFNYPILRMFLQGSVPGSIYQVELYADGNKVAEMTTEQLKQNYEPYGFQFGKPNYQNQTYASDATLQASIAEPRYFDAAFIADPDQALGKALRVGQNMILRVYSSQTQQLSVLQELLPGSYSS